MGIAIFETRVNALTVSNGFLSPNLNLQGRVAKEAPFDAWIIVEQPEFDDLTLLLNERVLVYGYDSDTGMLNLQSEASGTYEGAFDFVDGPEVDTVAIEFEDGTDVFTNGIAFQDFVPFQSSIQSFSTPFPVMDAPPAPNVDPVAEPDTFVLLRGGSETFDLVSNDSDPDGTVLDLISVTEPVLGTVEISGDGSVFYTAPEDGTEDFFFYTIEDGRGGQATGAVTVDLFGPEDLGQGLSVEDAQTVAYLYEAALDRDGDIGLPGLNFWIDQREQGLSVEGLAASFLASDEFAAAFGAPDDLEDRALVEVFYRNVLNRDGEQGGVDFWEAALANPGFDRADLLLEFARSAENVAGSPDVLDLAEVTPGEWDFVG